MPPRVSMDELCETPACARPAYCRGQCVTHYHRRRREDPEFLRNPIRKPCKRCGSTVDVERSKAASLCATCRKNWRWCPDCREAWNTKGYKVRQNAFSWPCPMHTRANQLKVRMGITIERYSDIYRQQGGRCAIANCDERDSLHVDHDHACCPGKTACGRCIRGLICARHNHALGKVRDSIAELEALAAYLVTHHASPVDGGHGN